MILGILYAAGFFISWVTFARAIHRSDPAMDGFDELLIVLLGFIAASVWPLMLVFLGARRIIFSDSTEGSSK